MLIDSLIVVAAPIPVRISAVLGRTLEAGFSNPSNVAAEAGIIFQGIPRDRVVIFTHPEEATETNNRVSDLAAHLVDHQPLNRTNLISIGAVNGGAVNLVAADQLSPSSFHLPWCSGLLKADEDI